jgi:hypothetical protein
MKNLLCFFALIFVSHVHSTVPTSAFTFDFNVKLHGMNSTREEKIYQSIELLRTIFATPEFRSRILNHRYRGRKSFAFNKGLTNEQIYRKILSGMEKLEGESNNAMDVEIALFTDLKSKVLGYTKPNTRKIWMNTKYFNENTSPVELSSHMMHEWLHKLGFGHERKRCNNRKYSVPYAIGYIVKDLTKETYHQIPEDQEGDILTQWSSNDPERQNSRLR